MSATACGTMRTARRIATTAKMAMRMRTRRPMTWPGSMRDLLSCASCGRSVRRCGGQAVGGTPPARGRRPVSVAGAGLAVRLLRGLLRLRRDDGGRALDPGDDDGGPGREHHARALGARRPDLAG